ncbi:hypothetical protein, partial [Pseudomonas moraviensis]
ARSGITGLPHPTTVFFSGKKRLSPCATTHQFTTAAASCRKNPPGLKGVCVGHFGGHMLQRVLISG